MANKKITELNAITTLAATDVVPVVDVSADTTNKITTTNLFRTLPDGTAAAPSLSFASDAGNGVFLAGTDTVGISTGGTQRITVDGSGNVTISGDLQVNGATTTVQSTTVTIDDKNIELGSVASPSNTTADGGGITLKASSDKTIKWINSTGFWTFNTGVEIDGNLQMDDNKEIRLGDGQDLKIEHNGSNSHLRNETGGLFIDQKADNNDIHLRSDDSSGGLTTYLLCDGSEGTVKLYYYAAQKLATKSDGIDVTGEVQCDSLDVDGNGDIAGTLTSNRVVIRDDGSASPLLAIRADDAGPWGMIIGNDTYSTSTGHGLAFYQSDGGTVTQRLIGDGAWENFFLQQHNGTTTNTAIHIDTNRAVNVKYQNNTKLSTKSDGIDVTGEVQCDSLDVDGVADITGELNLHANLSLQDNDRINVGVGDDLQLFHDGSNSYIKEAGTGSLIIETTGGNIDLKHGTEYLARFKNDAEVELYYDNSLKLETKSDGIDVTGEVQCDSLDVDGNANISSHIKLGDNGRIGVGGSTTTPETALKFVDSDNINIIVGNGEKARIDNSGRLMLGTTAEGHANADNLTVRDTGDCGITIRSGTSNQGNIYFSDATSGGGEIAGAVQYDHASNFLRFTANESERLRIDSSGRVGIGDTAPSEKLNVAGNVMLEGGDQFLYLTNVGTGNSGIYVRGNTSGSYLRSHSTGSFTWEVTGSEKMRLDSSGRMLLGTTTEGNTAADDLTIATSGHTGVTVRSGTSHEGAVYFSDGTSGNSEYRGYLQYKHNEDSFLIGTAAVERLRINSNGAWGIEGASNYGTSGQVLTSNGNDSPTWQDAAGGGAGGANAISMNDSVKINFGDSNDLQIYHDGVNSYIDDAGTGNLKLNGNEVHILSNDNSEYSGRFISNGAVELYYDGTRKFATTSLGVKTNGDLSFRGDGDTEQILFDASDASLKFTDNKKAKFGNDNDFQIYHDGTHSYIKDLGTGNLKVTSSIFVLKNAADSEVMLQATQNGAVELYHDNARKLHTKSDGVDVTGEVQCDSLDVDGSGDFTGDVTFRGGGAAVNVAANSDIRFGNGTWSGNATKIQHHSNILYISGGTNGIIFREGGSDRVRIDGDGHLRPNNNNTYDCGTSSYRWRNVYTHDLHLSNEGQSNDVDGTWGNYTIQEGENDLFLINRRNGKKYKFNLTEVS